MTDGETLIDEALAATRAVGRYAELSPGERIAPRQALVYSIYLSVQENKRGRDTDADVERTKRLARGAGIPESEIEAAVTAAHRDLANG